MLEDFDERVSSWSESFVRMVGRRRFLHKAAKGTFATVASLALGSFVDLKNAFAATCGCDFACGRRCFGAGRFHQFCPSGCVTCTPSAGCHNCTRRGQNLCPWSDGSWVSCHGLGRCGHGFRICRDCRCFSCSHACTLLSDIICFNCCSSAQIEAEMRLLATG